MGDFTFSLNGSAIIQAIIIACIGGAAKLLLRRIDKLDEVIGKQRTEFVGAIAVNKKELGDSIMAHRAEAADRFEVVHGELKGVNKHLAMLNGSVATMKEWQRVHEKTDDERHEEIKKALEKH